MSYSRASMFIAIVAILCGGCTKNKEQKKGVETLCSRTWTCVTVIDNGQPSLVDCMLSDDLTFNTSGTGDRHFAVKCAPTDPDHLTLQWNLSTDARTLYIGNFEGSKNKTTNMQVKTLSKSSLEVEYTSISGHTIQASYVVM